MQEKYFKQIGDNLKDLKKDEGQRIKFLKLLSGLLQNPKLNQILMKTDSVSHEFKTFFEELLQTFDNQNTNIKKSAQNLLVKTISTHSNIKEVVKNINHQNR